MLILLSCYPDEENVSYETYERFNGFLARSWCCGLSHVLLDVCGFDCDVDMLLNAQQIVQAHRNGASHSIVLPQCTLAAAIEHLVWHTTQPHSSPQPTTGTAFEDCLRQSPFLSGSTILNAIPAQAELVWLRRRESELRKAIAEQGFTSTTAKALSGAIAEIINNVWQHAQTTLPALLAYRSEQERFSVVIADLGVGVLNSLRTNPAYASLNSSMTALKKAMAVGVSRLPDSDGYGFDTVLRALADQWGGVRLRTGEAILEFHGTAEVRKAHASYGVALPGLQVAFACCANPPATPIAL